MLKNNYEAIEKAFNYLNAVVVYIDENFFIKYVNEKAALHFEKYGGKDLIGKSALECNFENSSRKLNSMYESFKNKEIKTKEFNNILEDRTQHIVYLPIYEDENVFKGCVELQYYTF